MFFNSSKLKDKKTIVLKYLSLFAISTFSVIALSPNISFATVQGILHGQVLDTFSREPIAGAEIFTRYTKAISNDDGYFILITPPGIYAVTVSSPEYVSVTFKGVTICQGCIVSMDFRVTNTDMIYSFGKSNDSKIESEDAAELGENVNLIKSDYMMGYVEGLVKDARTNKPISMASIKIDESLRAYTRADGGYLFVVGTGIYSITCSAPNYESKTYSLFSVIDSDTASRDFSLEPISKGVLRSKGVLSAILPLLFP